MSEVSELATLVHDYTMAEVDRIATIAVKKHYRSRAGIDYDERKDTAWFAIVDRLYSWPYPDPPEFSDLLHASMRALDYLLADHRSSHGLGINGPAPKFVRYWMPLIRSGHHSGSDGFSDHLCDVMALPKALSVLTPTQYQAIAALAAFGDMTRAAESVGATYSAFAKRVYAARERINMVWFEGETPRKNKTGGDTCRVGHSRAEHGRLRESDGCWVCTKCLRNTQREWQRRKREEKRVAESV